MPQAGTERLFWLFWQRKYMHLQRVEGKGLVPAVGFEPTT